MTARNPWRRGVTILGRTTITYTAIVLGEGFNDPPLRLNPAMRWYHVAAWSAVAFVFGVIFYLALETP